MKLGKVETVGLLEQSLSCFKMANEEYSGAWAARLHSTLLVQATGNAAIEVLRLIVFIS